MHAGQGWFSLGFAVLVLGCAKTLQIMDPIEILASNRDAQSLWIGSPTVSFAYQPAQRRMLVPVDVDGRELHWLLLDSGVTNITLFAARGRAAPLRTTALQVPLRAHGREASLRAQPTERFNLRVGPLWVVAARAVSLQMSADVQNALGYDGVLGREVFDRAMVEVDPLAGAVRLHAPNREPAFASLDWTTLRYNGINLELPVEVTLGSQSKTLSLKLDTGCGFPGLVLFDHRGAAFSSVGQPTTRFQLLGLGGALSGRRGQADEVRIGGTRFSKVALAFIRDTAGQGLSQRPDGLLCFGLIADRHVVFDIGRNRLTLGASPEVAERRAPKAERRLPQKDAGRA